MSSQGSIIIGLGTVTPYSASNYDWRWIYYITSGAGIIAWILLLIFLPETRWKRSKEELNMVIALPQSLLITKLSSPGGQQLYPVTPGKDRLDLDYTTYFAPTTWTYIGLFQHDLKWKEAGLSMLNTLRITLFPVIIWATITNGIFVIVHSAA